MPDPVPPEPPADPPPPLQPPLDQGQIPPPAPDGNATPAPNPGSFPPAPTSGGTPLQPPIPSSAPTTPPIPPPSLGPPPTPANPSTPPSDGKDTSSARGAGSGGGKQPKQPQRRDAFAVPSEAKFSTKSAEGAEDNDPTEAIPNRKRENLFRSFGNEALTHVVRLRDHGVLIIGCEHAGCAEGAILEMIYHPDLGRDLRVRWVAKHEHPLDSLLNGELRTKIGRTSDKLGGRDIVLLVKGSSASKLEEVRVALESRGSFGYDIKERFHVLIWLTGEAWREFPTVHIDAPVWSIDARPHILRHYGTSEEDLDSRLKQIAAAQHLPKGSRELWAALEGHLFARKDFASFLIAPADSAPVGPPDAEVLARELLDGANDVEKAALFVAAVFPELRIGEFNLLMQTLLSHLPPVEGATRRQPARTAAAYWEAEQERIFRRLRLADRASLEGSLLVAFTFPGLQEAMSRALFAPYQLAQLQRLHAAALLLNHGTPQRIVETLIDITARVAPNFPDVFHRNWLMNQLRQIEQWGAEFVAGASRMVQAASGAQLDWSAVLLELREHHRARHRSLLGRLAAMCRGFLATEVTASIAHGFLDDLINGTKPNCEDALEVIRRLRQQDAPNFDANARLRSLLDFVSVELRAEIFRDLLRGMRGATRQPDAMSAWRILDLVATWFPTEIEYDRLGEGARWALAFPYSVWEDYRHWSHGHREDEGDTPIAWLQPHPELPDPAERIARLAAWLAHPAFCAALNHVLKSTFRQNDEAYWEMLEFFFQPRFTVGEASLAELLAGFYALSGQPDLLNLADLLATKLPRPLLDKLRVLIRQGSEVSGDDLRAASKTEYPILKRRMRRAYDLASHLGGTTNASPPIR